MEERQLQAVGDPNGESCALTVGVPDPVPADEADEVRVAPEEKVLLDVEHDVDVEEGNAVDESELQAESDANCEKVVLKVGVPELVAKDEADAVIVALRVKLSLDVEQMVSRGDADTEDERVLQAEEDEKGVSVAHAEGVSDPVTKDDADAVIVATAESVLLDVESGDVEEEPDTEDVKVLREERDGSREKVALSVGAKEAVPQNDAASERLPLGEMLPSGEEKELGEPEADALTEREGNLEAEADGDSDALSDCHDVAVADTDSVPLSVILEGEAVCEGVPVAAGVCEALPHDEAVADMLLPGETLALDTEHTLGVAEAESASVKEIQDGVADGESVPESDIREGEADADAVSLRAVVGEAVAQVEAARERLPPGDTLTLAEEHMLGEGEVDGVTEGESREGEADGVCAAVSERSEDEESEGEGVPLSVGVIVQVPLDEGDEYKLPLGDTLPPTVE